MPCKIVRVTGATKEEVESKRFGILIGISLGNKWFNKNNLKEYLLWSLEYSKEKILPVVIADGLHAINYEVRNGYKPKRAMERALRVGDEKETMLREIIREFPEKDRLRIEIVRWAEIFDAPEYQRTTSLFYEEFDKNPDFKKFIMNMVRTNLEKSGQNTFNNEQIEKLCQYVLNELSLYLRGVEWKGKFYCLHPYPEYTKINELAGKMQKGEIFQKLYSKIDKKEAVIVELVVE